MPYAFVAGEKSSHAGKGHKVDYHDIVSATFLEDTNTFCTRTFMIRFAEECVELQDICQFRTEVDFFPGFDLLSFYLDLELCFDEVAFSGGPEFIHEKACKASQCLANNLSSRRAAAC